MSSRSLRPTGRKIGVAALAASLGLAGLGLAASPAQALPGFEFERLAGLDRIETAVEISEDTFASSTTALIARADLFPDALAGNYLAGAEGAPILLSHTDDVPAETLAELDRLGVTDVTLLGGTAALDASVQTELEGEGYTVDREAGTDRYKTAADIATSQPAADIGDTADGRTAILATGERFPDALTGGPLAYAGSHPLLLTPTATLGADAAGALDALDIEHVLILGGTVAVSQAAENAVEAMGMTTERLAGTTRYSTATAIAEWALANAGFTDAHINVATGLKFPDALTGGPHAGEEVTPIILANDGNTTEACAYLTDHDDTLTDGHIFGGTAAVSAAVEATLEACAGGTDAGQITLNSSSAQQGGTISGTITGTDIQSVTVSGCGLTNQTVPTSSTGGQFTLTVPSGQPAGACTLTFTITNSDGSTRQEAENVTITAAPTAGSASTRPELQAADIVSTSPATAASPGTVVRYTFDEPVTGAFTADAFNLYTFAGVDQGVPASVSSDPADTRSVLVRFAAITTAAAASQLSVATVDIGAVTDFQGQQNPEGDDAVGVGGTQNFVAGTTVAPDLNTVGSFGPAQTAPTTTNVVSFTFDQAAFPTANTTGYSLVLTDNTVVTCTGPAAGSTVPSGEAVAGGAGTNTITVVCNRATTGTFANQALSASNVARGVVQEDTVAATSAGAAAAPVVGGNPTQATQTPDANTAGPDLVSAELRPGPTAGSNDSVLYTFDVPVVTAGAAGDFFVYDSSGTETLSIAGGTCNGNVCEGIFAPGSAVENAVGGGVLVGSVLNTSLTQFNSDDEVGITNTNATTNTPGRTTGPDLTAVALQVTQRNNLTNEPTAYVAIYTFDEPLAAVTNQNDFRLFTSDGRLLVAATCTVGTAANSGANTVRCTEYRTAAAATPNSTTPSVEVTPVALALSAVLGTVDDAAVTALDGAPSNPEGAEFTTGGTGTRTL